MSILSTTGAITPISPPQNVKNGKKESNTKIFLFQERENLRLSSSVSVDTPISNPGGIISAGTPVDSYFLHFDRKGSTPNQHKRAIGSVTFDEKILGVIWSKENHNDTWRILGNPDTKYEIDRPQTFSDDKDTMTWSDKTLTVSLITNFALDQIRVITEHSVPPILTRVLFNGSNSNIITISEGSPVYPRLEATDPNRDAIDFFLDGRDIGTDSQKEGTRSQSTSLEFPESSDNGTFSYSYRAQAKDEDEKYSNLINGTVTVRVNNVAPSLTSFNLSRNVINEGELVSAQMYATDPGADTISFYLDGSFISTDTRKSSIRSASPILGPFQENGVFRLSALVRDDDGDDSNTRTQTLTVNNVAPTITICNLSRNVINEGESVEVQMCATDPGADTISFYLDGSFISTDTRTSGTREASTSLSYQDDGTFSVIVRAQDSDGAFSNTITRTLTVNNVAPTITSLTEDLSIGTNNSFSFAATATDPGLTDILTYEWDLDGDGNFDDFTGSSGEWSFSEPGDHEVKLRVSDGDGGVDEDSFTVTAEEAEELKLPEPYSFRFTDIKAVSDDPEGDKFQFSFEIINWTDTPAAGIKIALNDATQTFSVDERYPEFAGATVDENGRPLGPDRDPITGNLNIPNNGTVKAWDKTTIEWNMGDPILNRDLLGATSTSDAIALVPGSELISGEPHISDIEAVDNGDNVRDGFVFTVDHINESEILSFDMSLLDENGNPINSGSDSYNYGSGVVTIYRRPHNEATNPDALFTNTNANHIEGSGIPKELEEMFYNNANHVTEFT